MELGDRRANREQGQDVSATLANAPVDTAIRVLANMADLQPAFLDNVIYLTTKENAKRLEQESPKRREPPATEKEGGKEKKVDAALVHALVASAWETEGNVIERKLVREDVLGDCIRSVAGKRKSTDNEKKQQGQEIPRHRC